MRRPSESPTPAATYWDDVARRARAQAGAPLWRLAADQINRALLRRWLPPGPIGRVLKTDLFDELSTDGLAPLLAERSALVVGIDIAPEAARHARAASVAAEVAIADVRHLPFAAGAFAAVVSHSTLDHFGSAAEIRAALRELRRVLEPGGTLIVTLDNPLHPVVALRNGLAPLWQRLGLLPYAMGASLGPRALRAALLESGFAVGAITAVHHLPRLALVALDRAERSGRAGRGERAVRLARAGEALERWPTRYLTGQYVAAVARAVGPAGLPASK